MTRCPTCGETENLSPWGEGEYNCGECNTQFNEYDTDLENEEDIDTLNSEK